MTAVQGRPAADVVHARYVRWDGVGRPFAVVAAPVPRVPGPGEALVEIELATVCGSDLHTVAGHRPGPAPGVLGHEQVGRVIAVGPGVPPRCVDDTPVTPGLRVVWSVTASCGTCDRCRREIPQKCRSLRKYGHEPLAAEAPLTGGFATHCRLLAGTSIVAVPEDMPAVVAAPAACATATVAAVLAAAEPFPAAARALVSGAGMLGLTAVAMLAERGARVLAVDPDPARRAQALRFGAAQATPYAAAALSSAALSSAALSSAVSSSPVSSPAASSSMSSSELELDLAVEVSGASTAVQSCLDALAVGGVAVLAGSVSPAPAVSVDPERLVRGLHRIVGVHNYRPADLQTAVDFLARHHRRYPFAELVAGRHRLDELDAAFAAGHRGGAPRQAVVPGA